MYVLTRSSAQETLCLRGLLAYAARCGRRVQSLYLLPSDHPQADACCLAVDAAIRLAEEFAMGNSPDPETIAMTSEQTIAALVLAGETQTGDRRAAYAANAAYAVIDATRDALESIHSPEAVERVVASVRIAHDSAVSADPRIEAEAHRDRQRLGRLALGTFPETGEAVDPSESGPLGPLFADPPAPHPVSATGGPAQETDPANDAPHPVARTATDGDEILSPPPLDASTKKFREWLRDCKRKNTQLARDREQLDNERLELSRQREELEQKQSTLEEERGRFSEVLSESRHELSGVAHDQEQIHAEWIRLERSKRQILEVAKLLNEESTALDDRHRQNDERHAQLDAEREKLRAERAELQTQHDSLQKWQSRLLKDTAECARQEAEIRKAFSRLQDERKEVQKETSAVPTGEPTIASIEPIAGLWEPIGLLQQDRPELQSSCEQLTSEPTQTGEKRPSATTLPNLPVPMRGPAGYRENKIRPLRILLEPGLATEMQLAALFDELSKLYRQQGGPGVRFTTTGCRTWTHPPLPDAPIDSPSRMRCFVDVRGAPRPSAGMQSENIDPTLWNRFLSSLLIPLASHGDLAGLYEVGQPAEKTHDAGQTVFAAAHRAAAAYATHNDSALQSHASEPSIDAVTRQFRRLETLLKRLADEQHLTAELVTPDEIPCKDSEQAADSPTQHPIPRRSKIRRAAMAATAALLITVLVWVIAG